MSMLLCSVLILCKTDFGLAIRLEEDIAIGRIAAGTRRYMAPELYLHSTLVSSCSADVFSLALVIFEVITREHPYRDTADSDLPTRQREGIDPTVSVSVFPSTSPLGAVLHQCWGWRWQERPSVNELLKAVQHPDAFVVATHPKLREASLAKAVEDSVLIYERLCNPSPRGTAL